MADDYTQSEPTPYVHGEQMKNWLSALGIITGGVVVLGVVAGISISAYTNAQHEHTEKVECIAAGGTYLPVAQRYVCIGGGTANEPR